MRFTTAFVSMAAAFAFTSSAAPAAIQASTADVVENVPLNKGAPALEVNTAGLIGRADSAVAVPKLELPADRSSTILGRADDPLADLEKALSGDAIKRQLQVNPCTKDSDNQACKMVCGLIGEGEGVCKKDNAGKWACECH